MRLPSSVRPPNHHGVSPLVVSGISLLLGCGAAVHPSTEDPPMLVVNPGTGIRSIEASEARQILSGAQSTWPNGRPVVIVLPPSGSSEMALLVEILAMPEPAYRRRLRERSYGGFITRPLEASDTLQSRDLVARTAGAVGVLPRSVVGPRLVAVTVQ